MQGNDKSNLSLDIGFFEKAYKKLKSNAFYDKTNLFLRDRIAMADKGIEETIQELYNALMNNEDSVWETYEANILKTIQCIYLPKKISSTSLKDSPPSDSQKEGKIIFNRCNEKEIHIAKDDIQTFIDMNVEGHILGVIWIMLIGWQLDKKYVNCYGNRIREKLYNELSNNVTYSPYLFEPYYQKYESWRDTALDIAQEHLKAESILITTLDFTRFYYSVDITDEFMSSLLNQITSSGNLKVIINRVNTFVKNVINQYSTVYYKDKEDEQRKNILPIGFLPSNVLANECLHKFDKAILDGWNPIYYGRYVDDILIVEKIEAGSAIEDAYQKGELTFEKAFDHYLVNGYRWNGLSLNSDSSQIDRALFKKSEENAEYSILHKFTIPLGEKTEIILQPSKLKLFYFERGQSEALLKCFREKISKNKSEFRNMPEDDAVFQKDDYTEIYTMDQTGVNKLRDINSLKIDKYALSKYLGKYQRISGTVFDKNKNRFIKDIKKTFDDVTLIENYTLWERVITILLINQCCDELFNFIEIALNAINKIHCDATICSSQMQSALRSYLISDLSRARALDVQNQHLCDESTLGDLSDGTYSIIEKSVALSKKYLTSRMFDKTLCVVCPELIFAVNGSTRLSLNLTSYESVLSFLSDRTKKPKSFSKSVFDYKFYPYLITIADISLSNLIFHITRENSLSDVNDIETIEKIYSWANYRIDRKTSSACVKEAIGSHLFIRIGDNKLSSVGIALSSIKMSDDNFTRAHLKKPNRSYDRYKQMAALVNTAIKENANMLVMPEACTPLEWLPVLSRTCARNNLAVITGVEHIFVKDKVYNLTAVILPYQDKTTGVAGAHIFYHSKNHFAPSELQLIRGHGLIPAEGVKRATSQKASSSRYELYCWNDFWFSVYCCYELTSIADRALFQSFADAIIAVEWNHDINYYSNIIESLSRDIHCYCIQVNTSDYGDSRITQPTKTEMKDILRTKGGTNATVLIGKIDIHQLREFQAKTYELQKENPRFKPTPPNFDAEIAYKKLTGSLATDCVVKYMTKRK